jgi:hypothetical protein
VKHTASTLKVDEQNQAAGSGGAQFLMCVTFRHTRRHSMSQAFS